MVTGFSPVTSSSKTPCMPCATAKMAHKSFPATTMRTTRSGALTHIDLWGKYPRQSILGHQYYILFIDDFSRYITVNFLKAKTEAITCVKNYLTFQETYNKRPNAIHVDHGTEFI